MQSDVFTFPTCQNSIDVGVGDDGSHGSDGEDNNCDDNDDDDCYNDKNMKIKKNKKLKGVNFIDKSKVIKREHQKEIIGRSNWTNRGQLAFRLCYLMPVRV